MRFLEISDFNQQKVKAKSWKEMLETTALQTD